MLAGLWNDHPSHLIYSKFKAPSMDAFMAIAMGPEMMAWQGYNKG
jgi:hypothetical protein